MEGQMDSAAQVLVAIMIPSCFLVAVIVTVSLWMPHQAKLKTIEVLKAYAEKGEEPPASVLEAVSRINGPGFPAKPPPVTRGEHLSHVAGSAGLAIGAAGLAWWRIAVGDAGSPLPVVAIIVAIFFASAAAARLVAALTTQDGDR
jgi:hypothetical protein